MKTRATNYASQGPGRSVAILILLCSAPLAILSARAAAADDSANSGEDAAVKQVVAGFSEGWNTHDAHAMCASLADDIEWVNWRGEPLGSRQAVEDEHAKLFADLYKNTHRTDTVKSIRYIRPELAVVDDYWTMTGARKRDGSDWPYRAGYSNFLMAKRNGRWIVIVSHTADFNATAPAAK
ncbi:MAG TPA: SgcJ/EcaC family oxidoreductase [Candidatus Acidoferrales bacterium]|nr:SgcJ/EcaC family oxidoreductase [Candidatus Acidoferrales bacterium]